MRRYFIVFGVVMLVVSFIVYKMYNKPHRTIRNEASISITATELFNQFEKNEVDANQKYLDKAITISGVIESISENQNGNTVVVLKTDNDLFGVSCTLVEPSAVTEGKSVTIKGFCTGYLSDVVISQAIVVDPDK